MRPDARIHGLITKGGDSPNIILALAAASVYVRAAEPAYLRELYARVKACCDGAAQATGCRLEYYEFPANVYEPVRENPTLAGLFQRNLARLGLAESPRPVALALTALDLVFGEGLLEAARGEHAGGWVPFLLSWRAAPPHALGELPHAPRVGAEVAEGLLISSRSSA